ncbi:MAG: cyclic beta 1-2 glucan synthetase [Spirochaetes bacterium]|jgi:cyclic beta-1,2-glucan synthetase|nr:cyclic beta 1-2 glucan synthetase [Spirochaetota bacterium]
MKSRLKYSHDRKINPLLRGKKFSGKYAGGSQPLRSELFSADQMDKHGRIIAEAHDIMPGISRKQHLLVRLAENEIILLDVHRILSEAVRKKRRITPAAEWLLDNFYLIEEHIKTGRRHLPKSYNRELPHLATGKSADLPRVYDIAMEMISHGDGWVDPHNLSRFISSYQSVSPLKLGEIWAIPIMLRLTLIENLRRVAVLIAADMTEQDLAGYWADRILEVVEKDPKNLILTVAEMAHLKPPLNSAFVAELSRRLHGQSAALALPLTWIEQQLSEAGLTVNQLVQSEIQQQAANQVSMSNTIGSLRFLNSMNWHDFVESLSVIEHTLSEDPAGYYRGMDFATRDLYRHVIEKGAKKSRGNLTEHAVAKKAIRLARKGAGSHGTADRRAHVGYYLIDKGYREFKSIIKMRYSPAAALKEAGTLIKLSLFITCIIIFAAIFTYGIATKFYSGGIDGFDGWTLGLFAAITFVCALHPAIALTNRLAALIVEADLIPRMDFSKGVPHGFQTLVVVPSMITSSENIANLIEALEVRFLANRDEHIYFGLLTDFKDASSQTLPEDEALINLVAQKIEGLNEKYSRQGAAPFFLFHRPRLWNSGERLWMGYERKRGKLADLNALLRGTAKESFSLIIGHKEILPDIKYVITLDTDTRLPRDSAKEFAAAMAHPLNTPRYDIVKKRIVEGYGILQPRVAVILPAMNRSRYARLNGSEFGIDPYTRVVSDVYQDLFHEGSFIGKGIYDVDAFELALKDRLPENLILSHDLLDGCYARSGLLSDVLLYDDYPSNYNDDVIRRRRWIRGDWQLLWWLFPVVPGYGGSLRRNPISMLSRWKILDNLRRSITPAALVLFVLLGWILQSPAWFWSLALVAMVMLPSIVGVLFDLFRKPEDALITGHIFSATRRAGISLAGDLFSIVCLPYEAFYSMSSIGRALWRMCISRRGLLEWKSSDSHSNIFRNSHTASLIKMSIAPVFTASVAAYIAVTQYTALITALPLLFLWAVSPVVAWHISRPISRRKAILSEEQKMFLRKISRKTWGYFETFAGPEENWLVPDNFQEDPPGGAAHRTSPTNIGLSLLANLSAYDFGYICAGELINRSSNTLNTMKKLDQYRGHFYNWYDTRTLTPLHPLYISTVDSGNLAGHLLTLIPGLASIPDEDIINPEMYSGLYDTHAICIDAAGKQIPKSLSQFKTELESAMNLSSNTLSSIFRTLESLTKHAGKTFEHYAAEPESEPAWWAGVLMRQCEKILQDLILMAPWLTLPIAQKSGLFYAKLDRVPTLDHLTRMNAEIIPQIERLLDDASPEDALLYNELRSLVLLSAGRAEKRVKDIDSLMAEVEKFSHMEYTFLYDETQHLLSIGYNVEQRHLDSGYYDLLASEARLCSFIAIALGELPQKNWFALGRQLTSGNRDASLFSWSGSMFEYLMPLLVMPTYENTLLDQTYSAVVKRQIEYGKLRNIPWGVSESGYNALGTGLDYQYRAFGVPGLGLKRRLADDLVIAPYATALALMVSPEEACENLKRLSSLSFEGRYGFYEAVDYTPSRIPAGYKNAVVKSYMSHHSGMSLLSISYLLHDRPMQRRFESVPAFRSAMLLLQERIPDASSLNLEITATFETQTVTATPEVPTRIFTKTQTVLPEVQLLSNGSYHVMVTNAGGGYSRWKDMAVTRWREDATMDNNGAFCYIRDIENGEYWSAAYQPTLTEPDSYEVIFSEGRAEFRRRDFDIETHTTIVVSPEDDIELRRMKLTNFSGKPRMIDITSYSEVVLAPAMSDAVHPAFSSLFVQTEIVSEHGIILCRRRPRSAEEETPYMFHVMTAQEGTVHEVSYETDRMQFTGRGNTTINPQALRDKTLLKNSEGSVLDPIVSIRYAIALEPEESAVIDIVTGIGETRDDALYLVDKYRDHRLADRVFDLAWTHSQVVLRQLNATESEAQLYCRLAGSVIHANKYLRADRNIIMSNLRGQSGLWGYSISGDLPIVLVRIENIANIGLVRQIADAHAYWSQKGLETDLVIWNDDHSGYRQILQEQILGLIAAGIDNDPSNKSGGIFVRSTDQISAEDQVLMQTVARVVITDTQGSLTEQINRKKVKRMETPRLIPERTLLPNPVVTAEPRTDLLFFNGYGGFTRDGKEYIITTDHELRTPAPWVNVLANKDFGTVVSESGTGYTWSENAHEFRLTPWHNDPVSDFGGEAFYLRDEENGSFWSPMPLPRRGSTPYVARHGFGYSIFEHTEQGISTEVIVYVATDANIKFTVVKIHNKSKRPRSLTLTGYTEWVLGDLREKTAMHVVTRQDPVSGAVFARNQYNKEFDGRTAFFDVDNDMRSFTCDRAEFIGRNGTLTDPTAMRGTKLSNHSGAALDPCAAIQVPFELDVGEKREITFKLGAGINVSEATSLARRFSGAAAARGALEAVWEYWKHNLGSVQIETPDESLNVLANGWLIYQVQACRLWARSGFYQSGGAYGFRDQLQDSMALMHAEPGLVREHLLRAASRQFEEGDAQHWWHPPLGRGVRTNCSDDFLWLPLATTHYVLSTGDTGILDEPVSLLTGRLLNPDEDSYFDLPVVSTDTATLYSHCVLAIKKGRHYGERGLPLIGSGDWNDGMDRIGEDGKGESVWLAFFFYDVLSRFSEISENYGDHSFARECVAEAAMLQKNIEKSAWDGKWYRRAYFDDGTPLGSAKNPECMIDSISQSWSVLSGAGDKARTQMAMNSLDKHLIRRDSGLIQLLDPPFDTSDLNPGYIKGYVPGVRENGGQYTHAAVWAAMAFAASGETDKAWNLMEMINPVNHGDTPDAISTYKVEPYVMAADVYGRPPHTGRGGWTWYTGSAGWMYRLITESLLGLSLKNGTLFIQPTLRQGWDSCKIHYRYHNTVYRITVIRVIEKNAAVGLTLDRVTQPEWSISLVDDQADHMVEVRIKS